MSTIDASTLRKLRDEHFENNCTQSLYDQVTELIEAYERLQAENERLNTYVISGHEAMHKEMAAEIDRLRKQLAGPPP